MHSLLGGALRRARPIAGSTTYMGEPWLAAGPYRPSAQPWLLNEVSSTCTRLASFSIVKSATMSSLEDLPFSICTCFAQTSPVISVHTLVDVVVTTDDCAAFMIELLLVISLLRLRAKQRAETRTVSFSSFGVD
eukprot:6187972-Pleurochrysis_carterae.AAC.1